MLHCKLNHVQGTLTCFLIDLLDVDSFVFEKKIPLCIWGLHFLVAKIYIFLKVCSTYCLYDQNIYPVLPVLWGHYRLFLMDFLTSS